MIHLTQREKLLSVSLMIFAGLWALFVFAIKPTFARIETLNRVISEKQNELQKLCARSKEYIFLRGSLADLHTKVASQEKSFELLPFLELLIQECGLTKQVATMKQRVLPLDPSYYETIVEIKLENLTLRQLVDFILKVESSDVLAKTKSLYIKRNPADTDLLDSVVEIHNAKLTQNQIAHR